MICKHCSNSSYVCYEAAKNGHYQCLVIAHKKDKVWDERVCKVASKEGHLKCLEYAHRNKCPWNETTCIGASENNNLDCLEYAYRNGCKMGEETLFCSVENGSYDCFVFCMEHLLKENRLNVLGALLIYIFHYLDWNVPDVLLCVRHFLDVGLENNYEFIEKENVDRITHLNSIEDLKRPIVSDFLGNDLAGIVVDYLKISKK
jgi:hypothetical protein